MRDIASRIRGQHPSVLLFIQWILRMWIILLLPKTYNPQNKLATFDRLTGDPEIAVESEIGDELTVHGAQT